MKILIVSSYYYPAVSFGGPVPIMMEVGAHLIRRGHTVSAYASNLLDHKRKMSERPFVDEVGGVTVYYGNTVWNYRNFAITPDLRRFCIDHLKTFDIIHFYELRSFQLAMVSYYARKYQVPYVIQTLGTVPNILRSRFKKWVFDTLFTRYIFKYASMGIAKTLQEKEQMIAGGFSSAKIRVIPNGFNPVDYSNIKKGAFRAEYKIPDDAPIILFLGRVTEVKGIDILVKAFHKCKEKNRYLVIAGNDEGGYEEKIRKLVAELKIEDRVIFTGFIEGNKKKEALLDANLFVLPSRQENMGKVILEALSAGLPVITTSGNGIAGLIKDRVGLIVQPENVSELSEAIETLLNDPFMRAKFIKEMPGLLQSEFSYEKAITLLESVYSEVISLNKTRQPV